MTPKPLDKNTLFYGDNLPILKDHIPDESVDLIYLDPPFNSNRNYNVLFKDESGADSESQITAFEDTWHWGQDAEKVYHELIQNAPAKVATMIGALRDFIGANQMMAYLVMMTARLIELHRVLKPTGSLYLHCDPTASHYLKVVLDTIFGAENFQNEIIWSYKRYTATSNRYQRLHDVILYYTKSENIVFNVIRDEYGKKSGKADSHYKQDESGEWFRWQKRQGKDAYKVYLSEGKRIGDVWEIPIINASAKERIGYPTQKPLALLERIIQASSNEGDVILDPFCGCGTTISAAQKLNRRWIGVDVTHLSISLMKYRLKDSFGLIEKKDYSVIGEPESLGSARQLAVDDRYQFQWWALSLVQAKPLGGSGGREGKKGSDKGIDGVINFINDKNAVQQVLIQVKSGHVKVGDIRDLRGVLDRENGAIGVFLTLEKPSKDMITEAVSTGFYQTSTQEKDKTKFSGQAWQKDIPRIQILTIEELLAGKEINLPPSAYGTFKQSERIKKKDASQPDLL